MLSFAAAACLADEVHLKNGGVVRGEVVKADEKEVVVKRGSITSSFPRDEVEKIVETATAHDEYVEKEKACDDTPDARYELGLWCKKNGLKEQAEAEFEKTIKLDPDHENARRALGYRKVGDNWYRGEELMLARGYVLFEGEWVKKEKRESILSARKKEAAEFLKDSRMPEGSVCLRSRHFYLATDMGDNAAEEMLGACEALRDAFWEMFDNKGPLDLKASNEYAVCLFSGREPYEKYADKLEIKVGEMSYGWYSGENKRALAFKNAGSPPTLGMVLHETTHMLFHLSAMSDKWKSGGKLSSWFYEGLSEYFEACAYSDGKLETGKIHPFNLFYVKQSFINKNTVPLDELLVSKMTDFDCSGKYDAPGVNLAYAQSWGLVYFMLEGGSGKYLKKFYRYFDMERSGRGGPEAFEEVFGKTAVFERKWKSFMEKLQ